MAGTRPAWFFHAQNQDCSRDPHHGGQRKYLPVSLEANVRAPDPSQGSTTTAPGQSCHWCANRGREHLLQASRAFSKSLSGVRLTQDGHCRAEASVHIFPRFF